MKKLEGKRINYIYIVLVIVILLAIHLSMKNLAQNKAKNHIKTPSNKTSSTSTRTTTQPGGAIRSERSVRDYTNKSDEEVLFGQERYEKALLTLRNQIRIDNNELGHPIEGANEDYYQLRQEILLAISENPDLVPDVIKLFQDKPYSHLGKELANILAEVGSTEIQKVAISMALKHSPLDYNSKTAAFSILSQMETIAPDVRNALLENVQIEGNPELQQFTLMSLQQSPTTPEDFAHLHEVLGNVAANDNQDVRRHAVYQIGEWARSDQDLAPVRKLANDPDFNVRVRAVQSLAKSNITSEENQQILWDTALRTSEFTVARDIAIKGLTKNYTLDAAEIKQLESLSQKLKQMDPFAAEEN